MDRYEHLKWVDLKGNKLSWRESLKGACAYYGTFCGRWHNKAFWKSTAEKIQDMTEEQCKEKIIQIESEAETSLAEWRSYQ